MPKVGIDLDGIICDFTKGFFREANKIWPGRCDTEYQPTGWNDWDGLDRAQIAMVWDRIKSTKNWFLGLDAYSENMGALARFLYMPGNDVWIVTSRSCPVVGSSQAKQVQLWLHNCGLYMLHHLNYIGINIIDWSKKHEFYATAEIDYSVDDKPETVALCEGIKHHKAFMLTRSWNVDAPAKHRVETLQEFFDAIRSDRV